MHRDVDLARRAARRAAPRRTPRCRRSGPARRVERSPVGDDLDQLDLVPLARPARRRPCRVWAAGQRAAPGTDPQRVRSSLGSPSALTSAGSDGRRRRRPTAAGSRSNSSRSAAAYGRRPGWRPAPSPGRSARAAACLHDPVHGSGHLGPHGRVQAGQPGCPAGPARRRPPRPPGPAARSRSGRPRGPADAEPGPRTSLGRRSVAAALDRRRALTESRRRLAQRARGRRSARRAARHRRVDVAGQRPGRARTSGRPPRAAARPRPPAAAPARSRRCSRPRTSASASSPASSSSGPRGRRRALAASRSARSAERLATTTSSATPRRRSVATASAPIEPAPTITSARCRGASGAEHRGRRRPARPTTTDAPARSMPVSACTRLPTRSACCMSSCSTLPTASGSAAARVRVAQLAEDLRLADHHRVQAGGDREQVLRRRRRRSARTGARRASATASPARSASTAQMSARPPWKRRPSAYTSTRLQVDSTSTSLTCRLREQLVAAPAGSSSAGTRPVPAPRPARCGATARRPAGSCRPPRCEPDAAARRVGRRPARTPCGARGRTGSAARWRGRPCARRRPSGTASTHGAKFRMLVTPAATSRSQTSWAAWAGVAITRDRDLLLADHLGQLVDVPHDQAVDLLADPARVGVEQRGDAETRGWRTRRSRPARGRGCRRRSARPPGRGCSPSVVLDLLDQHGDVVADAARPVRARGRTGPCAASPS